MPFAVKDLKLPPDILAQINRALGGKPDDVANAALQDLCDTAAADVSRLTVGYVLDPISLSGFTRAIAIYRAYGHVGPAPKDVAKNFQAAWDELTAIAKGERPNLPKVATPAQKTIAGGWGSNPNLPGRMT